MCVCVCVWHHCVVRMMESLAIGALCVWTFGAHCVHLYIFELGAHTAKSENYLWINLIITLFRSLKETNKGLIRETNFKCNAQHNADMHDVNAIRWRFGKLWSIPEHYHTRSEQRRQYRMLVGWHHLLYKCNIGWFVVIQTMRRNGMTNSCFKRAFDRPQRQDLNITRK